MSGGGLIAKGRATLCAAFLAFAPAAARAACAPEAEPNNAPAQLGVALEGAACLRGAARTGDQDMILWRAPAGEGGLWRLRLEALPGEAGSLSLLRPGARGAPPRPLWSLDLDAETGLAESPPFLAGPEPWLLAVAPAGPGLRWRLYAEAVAAAPSGSGAPTDAFARILTGAQETTWRLTPEGAQSRLWDVALQGPPGHKAFLEIKAPNGAYVPDLRAADELGLLRAADLRLKAGDYLLRLRDAAPGEAYRLSASGASVPAHFAAEPDHAEDQAHLLTMSETAVGRLLGDGIGDDKDLFAIDAPKDGAFALKLSAPDKARLALDFLDAKGVMLLYSPAQGRGEARLGPFSPPPGRYLAKVQGRLPPGARYELALEAAPPPAPGTEAEPNDSSDYANAFAPGAALTGALSPNEPDYAALTIPEGALRLWDIEAKGEGLLRLRLYDGAKNEIAAASGTGGALLSRLALAPGRHLLRLEGEEGPWRLEARERPPGPPEEEREPNDDPMRAMTLAPGKEARFWLDHQGDDDFYEFTLQAPHSVTIEAALPNRAEARALVEPESAPGAQIEMGAPEEETTAGVWRGILPAGRHLVRLQSNAADSERPGRLRLTLGPPFAEAPSSGPLKAEIHLKGAVLAADDPRAQVLAGEARLSLAPGAAAQEVGLALWTSDDRWRLSGLPARFALKPGAAEALPFAVEAPPDLAPGASARFAIALEGKGGVLAVAEGEARAEAGAPASDPRRAEALPGALAGGLDLASGALGGRAPSPEAARLIDGLLDGAAVKIPIGAPLDIGLGGGPVAGVVLRQPDAAPQERLRAFRLEGAGEDGAFRLLADAELAPHARPQAFVFEAPRAARTLRLTPVSAWGGAGQTMAALSEIEAVAPPDSARPALDAARPDLGGHIVAASPAREALTGEAGVWGLRTTEFIGPEAARPFWIMGFKSNRAVPLGRLTVALDPAAAPDERLKAVTVSASLKGPLGPWSPVGRLEFAGGALSANLALKAPIWARALRFEAEAAPGARPRSPLKVEAFEDAATGAGRSAMGLWGDGAAGLYEALSEPAAPESDAAMAAGSDRAAAPLLPPATAAAGAAAQGAPPLWLKLEPPAEARRIVLKLESDGAAFALEDAAGAPVALAAAPDGESAAEIPAGSGPYWLKVEKPPHSLVVSWDTSMSVSPFAGPIALAARRMAEGLKPGVETMNFVPFRRANAEPGGRPLLDDFAADPAAAWAALQAYPGEDSDSDAESALMVAARALSGQPGRRAVALITDASFSIQRPDALWAALGAAQTRVFTLHIPTGDAGPAGRAQTALMRDWASGTGGFYRRFAEPADAEAAFREIGAELRRPAPWRALWRFEEKPLEPGRLAVLAPKPAPGAAPLRNGRAIALVLDASGSMLQKLGGQRKIDHAKAILTDLARKTLPRGAPVALRAFGQGGAGSCAGELLLPLGPLDPEAAAKAIKAVVSSNGAKTALAEGLRLAGEDLAKASGGLIVLVTDGEETCGGDPEAEIRKLRAAGLDVRLNIVGFDVGDAALQAAFKAWAEAGGGAYFNAADGAALGAALKGAIAPGFRLIGADGAVAAQGTVGGAAVAAPPGVYRLLIDSDPPLETPDVRLEPGQETRVAATSSRAPGLNAK